MCIASICCPVCDVINSEINLSFLIKPFFYITKKSQQKCKYLRNGKKAFRVKKKTFLIILKGLQKKKKKKFFLKGESPTFNAKLLTLTLLMFNAKKDLLRFFFRSSNDFA